jgi:hypothetical protein
VLILVGAVFRLALVYRVPPLFMPGDSQSYLLPAYELARGLGFDPIIKRPLGYPLFVAGVVVLAGEDLRALVFVQALVGLATVVVTYGIGRLAFGRPAGMIAGLTAAIGGQLLIFEHYVLAESVFALLIGLAVLALMAAVRQGHVMAMLGGLALGVASLFRPVAEVMLLVVPAFFLVTIGPRRRFATLSVAMAGGFLLAMVPATSIDAGLRGGPAAGAIGEHLIWRLTRAESGYITRDDAARAANDPQMDAARRFVIRRAQDRMLPQEIYHGLRLEFGLSPAEADRLMLSVAIDAIARQPVRYLASTGRMTIDLFLGEDQRLGDVAKRDGEARYSDPQSRQRTWFDDRILHLGEPPAPAVQNEFDRAELLTGVYQPGRVGAGMLVLFLAGTALAALGRPNRLGLLPSVGVVAMLLANAALASAEARFRYPLDPLIAVVSAGGLVGAIGIARAAVARRGAARQRPIAQGQLTPSAAPPRG